MSSFVSMFIVFIICIIPQIYVSAATAIQERGTTTIRCTESEPCSTKTRCPPHNPCVVECVGGTSCQHITIEAATASELHIFANGQNVLSDSIILCPEKSPTRDEARCVVHCTGYDSCRRATIFGASATDLQIFIESGDESTYGAFDGATVFCPEDGSHDDRSCYMKFISSDLVYPYIEVYAMEGLNDMSLECIAPDCSPLSVDLHCKADYSANCMIDGGISLTQCASESICNDYKLPEKWKSGHNEDKQGIIAINKFKHDDMHNLRIHAAESSNSMSTITTSVGMEFIALMVLMTVVGFGVFCMRSDDDKMKRFTDIDIDDMTEDEEEECRAFK